MSGNLFLAFSSFSKHFYPLPPRQVLRLSGPDAVAFAQAQLTNDVRTLADGCWQWTAWLNAKGRVIAIFQLLRLNPQQVLLLSHDDNAAEWAEQLQTFVFRRKVRITVETVHLEAAFQVPEFASGAALAALNNGVIELDMGSADQPRVLRLITDFQTENENREKEDKTFILAWQQADLCFGLPYLTASQYQQWTPQQLGLTRLAAYSVKKGCYPGQEIVARTHFLGKAKRNSCLLALSAPALPGSPITDEQHKAVGTVVSCVGLLALAVLPVELDNAAAPLFINGETATVIPFLDGLGR